MTESILLTRPEVQELIRLGRSSIYAWMRKGAFPLPLQIGPGAVRWKRDEIESWIASRPRATGEAA